MKTLKTMLALSLAVLMLFALVSCGDKSAAVKKAFEKEGYTVTVSNAEDEDVKDLLEILFSADQIEELKDYEILLCKKDGIVNIGKTAIILKYPSAKDLKAALTVEDAEGNKDTSRYDDGVEDGIINGNCMILTLSSDSKDIFKKV